MKKKLILLIILLTFLMISCKTVEPIKELEIPTFEQVRPTKPKLEKIESINDIELINNYNKLVHYTLKLESFIQSQNLYIKKINDIIK